MTCSIHYSVLYMHFYLLVFFLSKRQTATNNYIIKISLECFCMHLLHGCFSFHYCCSMFCKEMHIDSLCVQFIVYYFKAFKLACVFAILYNILIQCAEFEICCCNLSCFYWELPLCDFNLRTAVSWMKAGCFRYNLNILTCFIYLYVHEEVMLN